MIEKHCSKCHSNNIDELAWINEISGEITMRMGEFYCQHCQAKVDIILTKPALEWIEDIEPLDENTQIIDEPVVKTDPDV